MHRRGRLPPRIAKIAAQAGMSPGHVTHYPPDERGDSRRLIERVVQRIKACLSPPRGLDPADRLELALEAAFSDRDLELGRLIDELVAISHTDAATKEALASLYGAFERWWDDVVEAAFPDAGEQRRRDVTRSLVWLTNGARRSHILGLDDDALVRSRRMARQLVESLRPLNALA